MMQLGVKSVLIQAILILGIPHFLHKELKLLLKREFINFLSGVNRQMEVRPRFIFVPRMPVVKMYKNSLLRKLENLLILHQNGMVLFIVQL